MLLYISMQFKLVNHTAESLLYNYICIICMSYHIGLRISYLITYIIPCLGRILWFVRHRSIWTASKAWVVHHSGGGSRWHHLGKALQLQCRTIHQPVCLFYLEQWPLLLLVPFGCEIERERERKKIKETSRLQSEDVGSTYWILKASGWHGIVLTQHLRVIKW